MKKIFTILSIVALAALTVGCAKEIDTAKDELVSEEGLVQPGEETTLTVVLNVPESSDTKTSLGAKDGSNYPVYWSTGDVITLNGTAATEFTPVSGNASATAKFKVTNLAVPYNFLYNGVAGQGNQVTFPANQAYVAGGFDPAAMPMYASVNNLGSSIPFSHVASLLKFSITGEKKIDSVTLTAADANMSLSGNFTIGAGSNGLLDGSLTPASAGGSINYNFGGHIQLSDTPFVFYVAVPAGTYAGGIALEVVDNDSGHMNITVLDGSSNTVAPGKVLEFDNVTYIPAKENNLKQILNAATFQEFVSAVAGGNKTLNARLTPSAASIDLSSIAGSFESIEDYKGIFDGNGKTLSGLTKPLFGNLQGVVKNLTLNSTISITSTDRYWGIFANSITPSLEVDDVPGLQNCTASGSIIWTPSSEISSYMALGGLVGNNWGGSITGCTNNAAVTFADGGVTHTNQPSVGGVVGRTQKGGDLKTQGDISNCTNNGTVTVAAKFSQGAYIGGVLGYQVEKAETMSGCVNHGLVKVTSTFSTSGALHLAGVAGMAKGTLENCTNASDGVVTSEACSVGTYLCQGGVVGRLNDDSGRVYETLTNAGTLNVAATGSASGALVGGVAGRCDEGASLDGVTNSGNINYTAESDVKTHIGGITAQHTGNGSIVNCQTTGGTITYSGTSLGTPTGANLYIGGIVGTASKDITSCTNAMTINVGGSFSPGGNRYWGTGGIAGRTTSGATVSGCLNTGNITWSQQLGGSNGYSYLGGIVGYPAGSIVDSSNGGTITFSGKNDAQNPYIGGIAGDTDASYSISGKYSSAPATNYGTVVINTTAQSKKYVYAGGIAGRVRCSLSSATNAGQINVTSLTCTSLYLGGIAGTNTSAMNGNNNLADGDITVSGLTSKDKSYIGGVVGLSSAAVSGNNAGDVVATSGSTSAMSFFIGGIVGRGEANISASTNSGAVTNACPVTGSGAYMQVGGIVGYNNESSAISDCHNTGNVSNTANCNAYLYVGGITSESDAAISDCDNTGNVSNSGNSGNGKWISIGGIAGTNSAAMTSSHNEGAISNSGLSDEDVNIGGVAGLNSGKTITSCYNSGAVNNSGNSKDGYNVSVGGLVGWSSANSVYVTCYNEGDVENSGNGSNTGATAPGARVAGLIASASGANTISGDADNYNYNNGEVYEHSASARAAVGGVCAWANNASTSLDYAQNKSGGVIWVEDGEYTNVYVGGVLGVETAAASFNYTKNAGKIGIRNITLSKAAYIGGVHGGFTANGAQTITGCENTGAIDCPDKNNASENMMSTSTANVVTYIGGISSGAGNDGARTGKTFTNCINRGEITVYNQLWTRLGGCVGYANQNPGGCENHGKILYYRKTGGYTSGTGGVGGVIGYINIASVSNLTNTGGVQTTGSKNTCYTGGIVGEEGGSLNTMINCNVGKSGINIVGAGAGSFGSQGAGLFSHGKSAKAWTFTGCKVITGTKCQGIVVTADNMAEAVVGRNHASSITDAPTLVSSF